MAREYGGIFAPLKNRSSYKSRKTNLIFFKNKFGRLTKRVVVLQSDSETRKGEEVLQILRKTFKNISKINLRGLKRISTFATA